MAACRDEAAGAPAGEPRYPAVMAAFDQVVTATASDADWDAVEALAYGRWDAAARARGERGAAVRRGGGRVFQGPAVFDPAATNTVLAALDAPVLLLAGRRSAARGGGGRGRCGALPEGGVRGAAGRRALRVAGQPGRVRAHGVRPHRVGRPLRVSALVPARLRRRPGQRLWPTAP